MQFSLSFNEKPDSIHSNTHKTNINFIGSAGLYKSRIRHQRIVEVVEETNTEYDKYQLRGNTGNI